MTDTVTVALITGGYALGGIVLSAGLGVIVKKLSDIKEQAAATHILVNNQLTAANTKIAAQEAVITALNVQLGLAVRLQAKTEERQS